PNAEQSIALALQRGQPVARNGESQLLRPGPGVAVDQGKALVPGRAGELARRLQAGVFEDIGDQKRKAVLDVPLKEDLLLLPDDEPGTDVQDPPAVLCLQ